MQPTINERFTVITATLTPLRELLVSLGPDGEGRPANRWGLRGVPAKTVDLWVANPFPDPMCLVELGTKPGRYDGRERDRIQLTTADPARGHHTPPGHLIVQVAESEILLVAAFDGKSFVRKYGRKPHPTLEGYDVERIIWWHYRRWFQFLPWEDVKALSKVFEAEHPEICTLDLNAANRLASRDLYRLARSLGWRKLPKAIAERLGLDPDSGPWYSERQVLALQVRESGWTDSGAGDHTIRTAHGIYEEDEFKDD